LELLTYIIFFGELHIFLQLSWISLFWTKRAFVHLENSNLQEVFLSKPNSVLTGKQCGRMLLLLTQMVFCREIRVFPQNLNRPIWNKKSLPHLEKYDLQEVFISKTHSFLPGKQSARCSCRKQRCLSPRVRCVLSNHQIGLCGTKWSFLYLQNYDLQEVFLSKLTQFSQGNNFLDATASNTNEFLFRDKGVSSTQLNRPIWNKDNLSPSWVTDFSGSIPSKN
jgi:hypothetical protein